MIRMLVSNACFAYAAYQQADMCAEVAGRVGFATGILMLFFCFLANRIFFTWLKTLSH